MEETRPKTFVFVLMPFDEEFGDTYEVGIKAACKDAGAYCERVDEQLFVESIVERIYNQIAKADVIVADMSGRNPNVFFEVGYAYALNKRVILLTNSANDIPFDLKHYPHIIYSGKIAILKSQLESKIRWCIENPKGSLSRVDVDLQFFIKGMLLAGEPTIHIPIVKTPETLLIRDRLDFNIDIHNPTSKVCNPEVFSLSIETPRPINFVSPAIMSYAQLPGGRYIYNIEHTKNMRTIFPGGWSSMRVMLDTGGQIGESLEIMFCLFTELGRRDYRFKLVTEDSDTSGLKQHLAAPQHITHIRNKEKQQRSQKRKR